MGNLIQAYDDRLRNGELETDEAQRALVLRLADLLEESGGPRGRRESAPLGWLFGARAGARHQPKGLYIFGAVGRGKTMLMDLFFEAAAEERKRRVHFQGFMADVHARIHEWRLQRKLGRVRGDDPIAPVAEQIAAEARLLCLDEFSVADIADAMILGRLFTRLFELDIIAVATSNVAPERLYEGGLNRALFLPFIDLLRAHMDVFALEARTDFRLEKLARAPVYLTPADSAAAKALDRAFLALAGVARGRPLLLNVLGRELRIPQAAGAVARFGFDDLCDQALGPLDYLEIARRFHTLIVDAIPVMGPEKRNQARRFIWLIDALYDMRVKLVASAQAPPDRLYVAEEGRESLEFPRTASRLFEMGSQEYLAAPHGRPSSEASGDTSGLVET